jgi:protein-L-isoaspartate(D-aspartate) O-methyltransferase
MSWRAHGHSNASLISALASHGVIRSARVRDAMMQVDRAHFVGEDPYMDSPQPIGANVTISAPHMHAHALEELEAHLRPGSRFLDIGSGSGIMLAYAARMVVPGGKAVGVEHIDTLVEESKGNLRKDPQHASWLADGTIEVHVGDGFHGHPPAAPFDAIHVGAAAPSLPDALVAQLAPGGRMVIPVGHHGFQELMAVDKHQDGSVTQKGLVAVSFVPLTTKDKQLGGHGAGGIFGWR